MSMSFVDLLVAGIDSPAGSRLIKAIASALAEELRGPGPASMIDQSTSLLGARRHAAAARRRLQRGEGGAAKVGRRWLMSPEAIGEELQRCSGAPKPLAPENSGVRAALQKKLQLIRR